MNRRACVLLTVFLLIGSLSACGDKASSSKAGAKRQEKSYAISQNEQQQSSQKQKSYQIIFDKFEKSPTFDYNSKEVELLTACFEGINIQIKPGQEFSHSATASADIWSMSLKMTGQYGETTYRDGVISALKGQMEFSAENSDPRSFITYKFSGPFVLPFETLRPTDPDHESIRIGQADVVGERESYLEYYESGNFNKSLKPPEDFLFTVDAVED
ncbi:MAG TPA: hypothetical protein DD735_07270 [Clostridiales bacterium]|nr:hypothetical protein [Clostridiales bacterium]